VTEKPNAATSIVGLRQAWLAAVKLVVLTGPWRAASKART
jgi:hypothetical protein